MIWLQLTLVIMINIPKLNGAPPQNSAVKELKSAEFSNQTLTLYYEDLEEHDTAALVDEGDCIYSGHLAEDALSNVLVTGCENETLSIQVHSTIAGDRLFSLKNGSIVYVSYSQEEQLYHEDYKDYVENDDFENLFPVVAEMNGRQKRDLEEDYDYSDYYDDEPEENPEFEENSPHLDDNEVADFPLPGTLIFNINVYLDKAWYQIPGSRTEAQATRRAKQVLKHAKKLYEHQSLVTKIDLQFGDRIYKSSAPHLHPNLPGLDEFEKHLRGPYKIDNKYAVAHLHLTANMVGKKIHSLGKAKIASICNKNPKAIVKFKNTELRTAMTVAHELGHVLGMAHDFKTVKNGRVKCQTNKRAGITVMNYGSKVPREVWSNCSNYDFKDTYTRILVGTGGYCLKNAAVLECKCNGKADLAGGECKNTAGDKWCYVDSEAGCSDKKPFFGSDFISYSACSMACQPHEWQCKTDKKCIPQELRCDFIKRHCSDGSDEANCPLPRNFDWDD